MSADVISMRDWVAEHHPERIDKARESLQAYHRAKERADAKFAELCPELWPEPEDPNVAEFMRLDRELQALLPRSRQA